MNDDPNKKPDASPFLNRQPVPKEIHDLPLEVAKRIDAAKKKREPKIVQAKLP